MTTCVLGLGNVLMGDDGFGPAVVRAFDEQHETGDDLLVVDLGTPGLDLIPWLLDVDRVIVVDTIRSERPAGTLQLYDKGALLRYSPVARTSPHDPGVKESLRTLEFAGRAPREVTLIGVVPSSVEPGLELSPAVRQAVPQAVQTIARLTRARRRTGVAAAPS